MVGVVAMHPKKTLQQSRMGRGILAGLFLCVAGGGVGTDGAADAMQDEVMRVRF
jgi:hypothetical protein